MSLALADIERQYYTTVPIAKLQDALEQIYSSNTDDSTHARAAFLLGSAKFEERKGEEAKQFFDEAKRLAISLNDPRILADALHGEALGAFRKNDFATVTALEEESLQLATKSAHYNRAAVCYFMLGTISSIYGSHEETAEKLGQALQLAIQGGYIRLQVSILSKLAELYLNIEQYAKARNYAESCLTAAQILGNQNEINKAKVRLATIQFALQDNVAVLLTVEDVKKNLSADDLQLQSNVHTLMGNVYLENKRWTEAELEFTAALHSSKNSDLKVQANIFQHLATLYLKQERYLDALEYARQSLEQAEASKFSFVRKEALHTLHECYKGLGQYKEAHQALEEYNTLVAQSDRDLLNSRLEFHALRHDFEATKLKAQEGERRAELLRIELERKEQDLVQKTKHLIKQTEALAQFRDDLKAMVHRLPASDPLVREVGERIKLLPEEQLHWNDFDAQFNSLHPEFLHNLTRAFPQLTPQERKICPLLRLNLENEEIAKLLFLAVRSVENHRYRIRKKLGLNSAENLPEFLAKY